MCGHHTSQHHSLGQELLSSEVHQFKGSSSQVGKKFMGSVVDCLGPKDTRQPWEDPIGDLAAWGRCTGLPNSLHTSGVERKSFTDSFSGMSVRLT